MSATLHIHLNLPAGRYERIQEAAVRSDQPIESVLVDSLSLLFGAIAWTASGRLRELAARGKREALTDEEQAELTRLIDDYDRMTLLRSQALVMLQQRGHDVQSQLQRGA